MKTFSADEVFRMAQEIERNGIAYYGKAAEKFRHPEQKNLFEKLVEMEEKHLDDFTSMREEFRDQQEDMLVDVDNESGKYLNAFADDVVFDTKEDPTEFIKEDSSLVDILKKAIELEKNSIIFYIGLKDSVASKFGKVKVETIIQQELSHIAMISDKISELKS